ncbi:late competence development ComFB family protein [Leptolyngbya sp. GB1-A1]|uniref:late competence development ComFB family protein n=2 Tax=Leptolyngbya TaxID=47251 RepID=UPI0019912DDC|nr:late competence development ComFB family protein [Cyanobacteria bacterium FACHB-502]
MGTYKNIMELLVEEEVIRQCKTLSARASAYINSEELIAYALNQLPPLYATSEQGLEYQIQKGKIKFSPQITQAVQRAIAAVRRDPLRRYTPLKQNQAAPLSDVLKQVRHLLKDDDIQWETLPSAVERAIKRAAFRAAQGGSSWHERTSADRGMGSRSAQTARASAAVRPTAPAPSMPAPPASAPAPIAPIASMTNGNDPEYGWDDPLYFSR